MSGELPGLVVHGWWISWLVLITTAVVLVVTSLLVRRLVRRSGPVLVSRPKLLSLMAIATVIAYAGWRLYGQHLVDTADRDAHEHRLPTRLAATEPLVLAAAMPGTRSRALDALEMRLAWFVGRTEASLAQRSRLAAMRHGCGAEVRTLLRAAYYEEALAVSKRCDDAEARIEALVANGAYAEARRMMGVTTPLEPRVCAAIATEDWAAAAAALEKAELGEDTQRARCIADLFRVFGGEVEARARLAASAGKNANGTCQVADALAGPPEQRVERLHAIATALATTRDDPVLTAFQKIGWMYGGLVTSEHRGAASLTSPHADTAEAWLAPDSLEALDSAAARAWSVVRAVLRGRSAEASGAAVSSELRPVLATILQFRQGRAHIDASVDSPIHELVALRGGDTSLFSAKASVVIEECKPNVRQALGAAANGDGGPLADLIETCHPNTAFLEELLAVAPRVRFGRERLAIAVRGLSEDIDARSPFEIVHRLAWMRDVVRALGDPTRADRWQAIIDRHMDAFASRERLVALLLFQTLSG